MFSSKKLLTVLAAAGLSFSAACSSDGDGGSLTAICIDAVEDVCGTLTVSWSIVGAEDTDLPDEVVDEDLLKDAAAVAACAAIGITDAAPEVDPETLEDACDAGTVGTCAAIAIAEAPTSGYNLDGEGDFESSDEDVGETECEDLGGTWTAAE